MDSFLLGVLFFSVLLCFAAIFVHPLSQLPPHLCGSMCFMHVYVYVCVYEVYVHCTRSILFLFLVHFHARLNSHTNKQQTNITLTHVHSRIQYTTVYTVVLHDYLCVVWNRCVELHLGRNSIIWPLYGPLFPLI